MNNRETEDRKKEISRQMEEIRRQQEECDELQKEISRLEEESYWQNKKVKEVNDDLIDNYSANRGLQAILVEKEELLQKKSAFEKVFFEEGRDLIKEQKKKIESMQEACEEELEAIYAQEERENKWNQF